MKTWSDPLRNATRQPEAAERFLEALPPARDRRVDLAYALATIDESRHYRFEGCASIGEYGERHGLSGAEARTLAHAGRAMRLIGGLETSLLDGAVSFESAKELWLTARPRPDEPAGKERPLDRLLELACLTSTHVFARLARYIRACEKLGEPPVQLSFLVSAKARDRFRRAKVIAQHRTKKTMSDEDVFEHVVEEYLETHDVWARKGGKRRLPDTHDRTGRYIPVEVRRYVWERDGGRCVFPGCEWNGEFHFGHVVAHADGGSREGDNICIECPLHNDLERAGLVKVIGPAHAPSFEWYLSGSPGHPLAFTGTERPYRVHEEARQARADLAARRHLAYCFPTNSVHVPKEPPDPGRDGLTDLDLAETPPGAGHWVRDPRRHVPYLDMIDGHSGRSEELDRWLAAFFQGPH